ncbi:hypothetical protein [Lactiplantibacillus plantarum]|uniref:hypothetical protein n=1 Tax=Lactiplantibacillus plantarum TaxID=1590 RepID=UPI001BA8AE93|nr:hypothetical protein [Lactiplantibacillus plantarum]MBS0955641.1 hypothetical protein [Lactiplantibacillus plantarum]
MALTATQQVLNQVKDILSDGDQLTQKELWVRVSMSSEMKSVVYTDAGKPRLGLLQGILNRVVHSKVPGLMAIVDNSGVRKYTQTENNLLDLLPLFQSLKKQLELTTFNSKKLNGNQKMLTDRVTKDIEQLNRDLSEVKLAFKPTIGD